MTKFFKIILLSACMLSFSGWLFAGTTVEDTVRMENKAYKKHKKGIVDFSHKKHIDEYKLNCGECHHDKDNKPLNDLKIGDNVDNCIVCHAKTGKVNKKEKLKYHAEAIHKNCKVCHKAYNKKNKTKAAPTSCNKCHPKKKK